MIAHFIRLKDWLIGLIKGLLPNANKKALRQINKVVNKIIAKEKQYASMNDEDLKDQTAIFKSRLAKGETLDDILPDAFACVREASRRVLGMFHFPAQLVGGVALHKGMIGEMKTGEGKTLVATLPSYLNALTGYGVHIVTVNDYLAKRDSDEMGRIHRFLGLTVGCILESLNDVQRQQVYACDIVYATNNQLGFDYLKDNMKYERKQICMRGLNYAIIDEADSVLIDEARTPLIISGSADRFSESCVWVSEIVSNLGEGDYEVDEKMRSAILSEEGIEKVERMMRLEGMLDENSTLYDVVNIEIVHEINQALKAKTLFRKDVDYMVKDDQVFLIDEFTGRVLDGRRYSDGLHQAIEAKEGVKIQMENHTMASITFQKYFALYNKISGMSGTCMGESEEFSEIYKVETISIPTHRPMVRKDLDDEIYRTFEEKFEAIIKEVKDANDKQQPILLITGSIEASEIFSNGFNQIGLNHQVLNARHHKEEAEIIADAGMPGAITIATNMAGRGTDIQLGGNLSMRLKKLRNMGMSEAEIAERKPEIMKEIEKARAIVIKAGGLYVIGTERNESRRVDDQARGRSGRQGDEGKSKFFLSLDDNLIRVFGSSDKLNKWLLRFGLKQGEAIIHPFISKAIARAQHSVEARNFDWRKNVFKYDQVLDEQRKLIYKYRNRFLNNEDLFVQMEMFVNFKLDQIFGIFLNKETGMDLKSLHSEVLRLFGINLNFEESTDLAGYIKQQVEAKFGKLYEKHSNSMKMLLLQVIDDLWKDHLHMLDILRQSVNLKAYAQKDPLNEYKKEAFVLFENLLANFRDNSISFFFHMSEDTFDMAEETSISPDAISFSDNFDNN